MKRAIGIIRVSRLGEDAASPEIQADRIADACDREHLDLILTHSELDVSGGTPLDQRPGLRAAVEAVEQDRADVIVVAYFDRLVRSLRVQQEVVDRVEAAGGEVLTLDVGRLTNGTAAQRLTGNFLGAVAQFVREQSGEKSAAAQQRAVERGVMIGPVPLGYLRGPDKRLIADPGTRDLVRELFERRAAGASMAECRDWLAAEGIQRTSSGVAKLLRSRVYVGEIHFRGWSCLAAHEPLIDNDLFDRVQRASVSAGRRAKSTRLLPRLGVLRCGTCGAKMTLNGYATRTMFYRCGADRCARRVTVGADLVERTVQSALASHLASASATASLANEAATVLDNLTAAQERLDRAIRTYASADLSDEPEALSQLHALRARRDALRARSDELQRLPDARIYGGRELVERASIPDLRDLLVAAGCRVRVLPGRRDDRIVIEFAQPLSDPVQD